jgi:hypothetical protein
MTAPWRPDFPARLFLPLEVILPQIGRGRRTSYPSDRRSLGSQRVRLAVDVNKCQRLACFNANDPRTRAMARKEGDRLGGPIELAAA